MNPVNYYPVSFQDFERIKGVGNYVVTYALLDDRIHLEMAIENAVFATQKFFVSIQDELPDNYDADYLSYFIRKYITKQTSYQYYPTAEEIIKMKQIKLYSKLIVRKYEVNTELDSSKDKIVENDKEVRMYNDEKVIMVAEKVM